MATNDLDLRSLYDNRITIADNTVNTMSDKLSPETRILMVLRDLQDKVIAELDEAQGFYDDDGEEQSLGEVEAYKNILRIIDEYRAKFHADKTVTMGHNGIDYGRNYIPNPIVNTWGTGV